MKTKSLVLSAFALSAFGVAAEDRRVPADGRMVPEVSCLSGGVVKALPSTGGRVRFREALYEAPKAKFKLTEASRDAKTWYPTGEASIELNEKPAQALQCRTLSIALPQEEEAIFRVAVALQPGSHAGAQIVRVVDRVLETK